MSDDPKVSPTTETVQNGADAVDTTSPSSEDTTDAGADAAGADDELTRLRDQALRDKILRERHNEEMQEMRQRLQEQQRPAYSPPTGADPRSQQMNEELLNLQLRAQSGDGQAMMMLGLIEQQQQMAKATSDELMIARLPAEDQATVRKLYSENRQRFGDPQVAHAWVERERLQTRAQELDQSRADLRRAEERKRNGVVSVTTRPVAAPEAANVRMTMDQFQSKHEELVAQGKTQEAWALSKRAATGELFGR
jgi:hypothetical protein